MDDIGQRQVERIAGIATPGLATWGFHGDRRIGIGKSMKRICVDVWGSVCVRFTTSQLCSFTKRIQIHLPPVEMDSQPAYGTE